MNRSRLKLLSITFALILPMRAFAAVNSHSMDAAAAANKAYESKLSSTAGNSGAHAVTLRDLFDPVYYAFANPDAVTEAGSDPEALFYHFITKGIHQGYLCNSYFNIYRYRADHPELEGLLGDNWDMWVLNFFTGSSAPSGLRAMFDPVFYAASHPELAIQYGNDPEALYDHYINIGLSNGYSGNPYFDLFSYFTAHQELMNVYGNNWDAWIADFYTRGTSGGAETEGNTNNRLNTYKEDGDSDSSERITDGKGNILVPIEEVIRYHTLDELREKCGDSLVLITDKYGYVTFVGGHFTDVMVSDEYDSIKAIECMLDLIGFQEGKILRFSQSVEDSMGNVYYQFAEEDEETGKVNILSVISLGVDDVGKVISLSSNCGAKLSSDINKIDTVPLSIKRITEYLDSHNQTLVSKEIDIIYNPAFNYYGSYFYGIDEYGYIYEYFIIPDKDEDVIICNGKYSDVPTKENSLYSFSFLFSDDVETEDHVFKDYFDNDVTLSVASMIRDGKKYYYLVDKDRKIAANVQNPDNIDFFNKGFESLDDVYSYYVQSMLTVQRSYDFYKKIGFIDQFSNMPFIISFIEDDTSDNATCEANGRFFSIKVNNNKGNASFDSMAHEIGHAVLYSLAPTTICLEESSIHEAYADITGNLLEMLCYLEGYNIGNIDFENWPIEESTDSILRSMGEPEKYNCASKIGGENYKVTFFDDCNAHYHANIIGNICYRMNKELNIPLEDLFKIWYDSMPNVTSRSTYKDIQGFIEYSTMMHGYPELADEVSKFFEEANVDGYSDSWLTLKPADGYVTYVPIIVDDYEEVYEKYLKDYLDYIYINTYASDKEAHMDKYGNIGMLIKDGEEKPVFNFLNIYDKENHGHVYCIRKTESKEPVHVDAYDLFSLLSSRYDKIKPVEGLVSVGYDLTADAAHEYLLYRIDDEKEDYYPVYMRLNVNDDVKLKLLDDSDYGVCKVGDNGEFVTLYTFNTSDLKNKENPVIRLTENPDQASGLDIEVISGSTSGNSATQNQTTSDQVTNAALNSAAAKALNDMTEIKQDTDEISDENNPKDSDDISDVSKTSISAEDTEISENTEKQVNSDDQEIIERSEDQENIENSEDVQDVTENTDSTESDTDTDNDNGMNQDTDVSTDTDTSDDTSTDTEKDSDSVTEDDSSDTDNGTDTDADSDSESDTDGDPDDQDKSADNETDDSSSYTGKLLRGVE